jgi:hypothetical protein
MVCLLCRVVTGKNLFPEIWNEASNNKGFDHGGDALTETTNLGPLRYVIAQFVSPLLKDHEMVALSHEANSARAQYA